MEIRLWCYQPEKNHDKLYDLYLSENNGKFDVFCMYGRRGAELIMHVKAEGVEKEKATKVFSDLKRQKLNKGYKPVEQVVI